MCKLRMVWVVQLLFSSIEGRRREFKFTVSVFFNKHITDA